MKTKRTLLLAMLVASATSPWLMAQTTPPSAVPDDQKKSGSGAAVAAKDDEDTIVLSPFEVSSAQDHGYQATQTLAGTRISTNLADVGASIQVLTKQFLQDTGASDNQSLLQYTTNAEVAGPRSTFGGMGNSTSVSEQRNLISPQSAQRVRGLASADMARDYFITDIPWDSFNVDRIDILRGPNSILYGLGSPAGIINASTRSAEFRNKGSVETRTGSYGTVRSSLDYNQQLIPGVLAVRIDGLLADKKYKQEPAFENQRRLYGALRFDPKIFNRADFNTSFRVKYEHGDINSNHPRQVTPMDSVTPWFNPVEISASNPFGGMGKFTVNTVYDPTRTDGVTASNGYGAANNTTANFQPYLSGFQVQQPVYFIDGGTNRLDSAMGGYINNGWRDSNGNVTSVSTGNAGLRQFVPFYSVGSFTQAALNYNNWKPTQYFTDSKYGQYRAQSLLNSSVFDFNNYLIDGPNKRETNNWDAQNFEFQQNLWDNRVGLQLNYDHQHMVAGGWSLLGWQPTISIDITKNGEDYYTHPSSTGISNPNYGRPFVFGAGGAGGSTNTSDRRYLRASLFAELRPVDFTHNAFLLKLIGRQRFNGVTAKEDLFTEVRNFQLYANSKAWMGYWNGNDGTSPLWSDRPPQAVIYLGGSIANATSANGLNIPNIKATITLPDTGVRVFDSTWQNYSTSYSAAWNVPSSLSQVYNGNPYSSATPQTQLTQSSNPANYQGWTSVQDNLLRYSNGDDQTLVTGASKTKRQTLSNSGSYQGFFWNDSVSLTLGWRYDEVKSVSVVAGKDGANRQVLNLDPNVYKLPTAYPAAGAGNKGHSTSGGVVVHLNKVLGKYDVLPVNVSLSYNESSNFQVTNIRTDVYGKPIGNPRGKTYEYGARLSTKNDKLSLTVVKYTTALLDGTSTLANSGTIGSVVATGLTWRNIFLYQMGGYDWGSRNQPSYRNTWTNAFPVGSTNVLSPTTAYTQAQADLDADKAIDTWNTIQKDLEAKNFFKTWNFTPTTSSVLVNRSTYAANPSAYAPDPATIANYSATTTTYAVTSDIRSKGYEYELTANPTANWRISVNASQTSARQTNVGGPTLSDYMVYLNSKLVNADGTPTPAGALPRYGGYGSAIYPSIWAPFLASYTLLKLNEGSDVSELRKWRYGVVTNYSFNNGFLKGVGVGGGYRWQDKVVIGYPVVGGGSIASYDLSKPYYGPAEDAIDLWLSYKRKLTSKIDWTIQLNVYNVGKKDKLIPISVEPDGKTWASVRTAPVQEWQLTNTFAF